MTIERGGNFETPYVPFPMDAKRMKMLDYSVYEYINPADMAKFVQNLSNHIRLNDFDEVLINQRGGLKLFHDLVRLQNYQKWGYNCEYHRGGKETYPVDIILRNRKVLVVDDSLESGATLAEIFKLVGPESSAVVATIIGERVNPRVDVAVRIDDMKVAGYGADHGKREHQEFFRLHGGIVAIPPVPPVNIRA